MLEPDVAVHRRPGSDAGSGAPPTLCVTIAAGPVDLCASQAYARAGVDHFWHLDSLTGRLDVLVRVDDDYRHAETVTFALGCTDPGAAADPVGWVDLGIGVLQLRLLADTTHPFVLAGADPDVLSRTSTNPACTTSRVVR